MPMTINGSGTITGLTAGGLPDATIVQADLATGVAGTGPAFSAYNGGTAQTIATATWTKVTIPSKEYDTANCFDTTNYRFTPNVAGYYQFVGCLNISASSSGIVLTTFYKNGTESKRGSQIPMNSVSSTQPNSTAYIYMNGSTDYVELYCLQTSAGSLALNVGQSQIYFQAALVRAA